MHTLSPRRGEFSEGHALTYLNMTKKPGFGRVFFVLSMVCHGRFWSGRSEEGV
ncbi:hypothetical protein DBB_7630 [Desulfoluna spongiiphila]|nr:hypothetical protein DBB_7630 [Desulfoluna spongiiphila]